MNERSSNIDTRMNYTHQDEYLDNFQCSALEISALVDWTHFAFTSFRYGHDKSKRIRIVSYQNVIRYHRFEGELSCVEHPDSGNLVDG